MKRYVKNFFAFAIMISVAFLAWNFYDDERERVLGETLAAKLQSIAKIVIEDSRGQVAIIQIASRDQEGRMQPFYLISSDPDILCTDIATQEQVMAVQSTRNTSMAMALRLITREVLPLDPSIKTVVFQLRDPCGQTQTWRALAESLKGVPQDSKEDAWLERLIRVLP